MTSPDPQLAAEVVEVLAAAGLTLASCESLTGGLLGATLTGVPGASAVYRGGLITYATELKHELAGVDSHVLATDGAVSAETARQLAAGARERCGADLAVALTGVAGPQPQEGKPAGTVWLGSASADQVRADLLAFDAAVVAAGRDRIRVAAVDAALRRVVALARS